MTAERPAELEIVIERVTIQRGRTFSKAAVDDCAGQIAAWIAHETARRWNAAGVPPTRAVVTAVLKVELQ